ncbi:hypothetical protein F6P93_20610 [Escherichia coli]|nr:hypothetical protein F6P93_20610 [Escherichia coli]
MRDWKTVTRPDGAGATGYLVQLRAIENDTPLPAVPHFSADIGKNKNVETTHHQSGDVDRKSH